MSPEEIRRRIDVLVESLLKELREIDREAGQKRQEAMVRSGLPPEFLEQVLGSDPPVERRPVEAPLARGLTFDGDSTILPDVSAISSEGLARGMAKSKSKKHPFVRALYERGMTVTQWAEKHDYKMGTVASWVAKGAGGRRIPQSAAKVIEKELGVPASLATWRNGITVD